MNFLALFRQDNPEDKRNDNELVLTLGDKIKALGDTILPLDDPEFWNKYYELKRAVRPTLTKEVGNAFGRGVDAMQSTLYGGVALAGDALGSDKVKNWGIEGYQRNLEEASQYPSSVPSYKDIYSPIDILPYAAGKFGEIAPSIAQSIGTGLIGTAVGTVTAPGPGTVAGATTGLFGKKIISSQIRKYLTGKIEKQFGKEFAKEVLESGIKREFGSLLGQGALVANSVIQNAGATYGDMLESGATKWDRISYSLGAGVISGALDSVLPARVLDRLMPGIPRGQVIAGATALYEKALPDKTLRKRFLALLADIGIEGTTESLQEAVQTYAVALADPTYEVDLKQLRDQMIDSGIAGALGGMATGSVSLPVEAYQEKKAQRENEAKIKEFEANMKRLKDAFDKAQKEKNFATKVKIGDLKSTTGGTATDLVDEQGETLNTEQAAEEPTTVATTALPPVPGGLMEAGLAEEGAVPPVEATVPTVPPLVDVVPPIGEIVDTPIIPTVAEIAQPAVSEEVISGEQQIIPQNIPQDIPAPIEEATQPPIAPEPIVPTPIPESPVTPVVLPLDPVEYEKVSANLKDFTGDFYVVDGSLLPEDINELEQVLNRDASITGTLSKATKGKNGSVAKELTAVGGNSNRKVTRNALVLRNKKTGQMEIRGFYNSGTPRVHGGESGRGTTLKNILKDYDVAGMVHFPIEIRNKDIGIALRQLLLDEKMPKKQKDMYINAMKDATQGTFAKLLNIYIKLPDGAWDKMVAENGRGYLDVYEDAFSTDVVELDQFNDKTNVMMDVGQVSPADEAADRIDKAEVDQAIKQTTAKIDKTTNLFHNAFDKQIADLWRVLHIEFDEEDLADIPAADQSDVVARFIRQELINRGPLLKAMFDSLRPSQKRDPLLAMDIMVNTLTEIFLNHGKTKDQFEKSIIDAGIPDDQPGSGLNKQTDVVGNDKTTKPRVPEEPVESKSPIDQVGPVTEPAYGKEDYYDSSTGRVIRQKRIPDSEEAIKETIDRAAAPKLQSRIDNIMTLANQVALISEGGNQMLFSLLDRIQGASDRSGNQESWNSLRVIISDKAPKGTLIPETSQDPAQYDPVNNVMWINTGHPQNADGDMVLLAITHELGHFFTRFVVGEDFAWQQWMSLTDKQRARAHQQYLSSNGDMTPLKNINGKALINNYRAMQEWSAYQFTRIVRGGLESLERVRSKMVIEGMHESFIDRVIEFYQQVRAVIKRWIGDPETSTKELDQVMIDLLDLGKTPPLGTIPSTALPQEGPPREEPYSLAAAKAKKALGTMKSDIQATHLEYFVPDGFENPAYEASKTHAYHHTNEIRWRMLYDDVMATVAGVDQEMTFEEFVQEYIKPRTLPSRGIEFLDKNMERIGVEYEPKTMNELPENQRREVALGRTIVLQDRINSSEEVLASEIKEAERLEKKMVKEKDRLTEISTKLDNARIMERGAVKLIKEDIAQLKQWIRAERTGYRNLGALGEAIKAYEKTINKAIAEKYVKIIERLIKAVETEPLSLFEMLDAIANSQIDLNMRFIALRDAFRQSEDGMLQRLGTGKKEVFVTLTSFAKRHKGEMAALQLRKVNTQEKAFILKNELDAIKEALSGTVKATAVKQREVIQYARLAGKIAAQRNKLTTDIGTHRRRMEKAKLDAEVRRVVIKGLMKDRDNMLPIIAAGARNYLTEGSLILDPQSPDDTTEQILETAWKMSWQEDDIASEEKWQKSISNKESWLANPANKQRDVFFYTQVQENLRNMKMVPIKRGFYKAKSFSMGMYPTALKQQAQNLGIPQADELARMFNRFLSLKEAGENKLARPGNSIQNLRAYLIDKMGLGRTQEANKEFARVIENRMKFYIEEHGTSIDGMLAYLVSFPEAARVIKREFHPQLREFIELCIENDKQAKNWSIEAYGRESIIEDDRIKMTEYTEKSKKPKAILRGHVDIGTGTFIGSIDEEIVSSFIPEMKNAGWKNLSELLDAAKDDQEIAAAINSLLTGANGRIWNHFVKPMAYKTQYLVFSKAANEDGERLPVTRTEAIEAFENSKGSPVAFMQALYKLNTAPQEDFAAWNKEQFKGLTVMFAIYDGLIKENENADKIFGKGSDMPGHIAIDSRKLDMIPPEHRKYRQASDSANRMLAMNTAFHAAFGRDGVKVIEIIKSMEAHFTRLSGLYTQLHSDVTNDGFRGRARIREMKKRVGKDNYDAIKESPLKNERVANIKKYFDMTWQGELSGSRETSTMMQGVLLLTQGILNGPKAALVQFNEIFFPFYRMGVNKESLHVVMQKNKYLAKEMFGSFMQFFGKVVDEENADFKRQLEIRGPDPDTQRSFKSVFTNFGPRDRFRSEEGDKVPVTANFFLRVLNGLYSRGYSNVDATKAIYNAFRPYAPFAWSVPILGKTTMMTYTDALDRMAFRGADFFEQNEDKLDDPTFHFTHKDLKMAKRPFEYYVHVLAEAGTQIETAAREAAGKREPYTIEQYRLIAQQGLDDVCSEGNSLNTSSPALRIGPIRFFMPLINWSINQAHNFSSTFKSPNLEVSKASIAHGLLTIAIGLLPAALGFSLLMDWFDENIMGKKNNIRPLFDKENWGASVIERVGRQGVVGMPFELAVLMQNVGAEGGDLRTASLDQRVVLASSIRNIISTVGAMGKQGGPDNWTYATVYRPLMQQFGGNGVLQYVDVFSAATDIDSQESRLMARTNARNYLRTAGRSAGLEVRNTQGGYSAPTPMTPHITDMILAAYANNMQDFKESYQKAINAAIAMDKADPEKSVKESFQGRHPMRTIFRTIPTESEYNKMLSIMNNRGRRDVREALTLVNRYGELLGIKPNFGKEDKPEPVNQMFRSQKTNSPLSLLPF